jgi:hypothetical protein
LIPGLVVTMPAGTRIIGPDGNPVSQLIIAATSAHHLPERHRSAPGTKADLWFFDIAVGRSIRGRRRLG